MEVDELDDVELNYLRDKALQSRQQNSNSSSTKSKSEGDHSSRTKTSSRNHHKVPIAPAAPNSRSPAHSSSLSSRSSSHSSSSYSSYSQQRSRSCSTHTSRSRSRSFSSKSSSSSFTSASDSPRAHTPPPHSTKYHSPTRARDRGSRTSSGRLIGEPVRYNNHARSSGRGPRSRPSSPYRSHKPPLQERRGRPPPLPPPPISRRRRNDIIERRNNDSYQRARQRSPRRRRVLTPPMRRRSPSPHRRHIPQLVRRHSPLPRRRSPSPPRRAPLRRRSLTPLRRRSPVPLRRRSPSPPRRVHRSRPSPPRGHTERQIFMGRERPERRIVSRPQASSRDIRPSNRDIHTQDDARQRRRREERKRRLSDRDSDVPAKILKSDDEETREVQVAHPDDDDDDDGSDDGSDIDGRGNKSSTVTGGIDALDEELDYDESMDTLELYLQEDEGQPDVTVKSKVQRPSVAVEDSPMDDSPISGDARDNDDIIDDVIDDAPDDVINDDDGVISDDRSSRGDGKEAGLDDAITDEDSLEEGEDRTDVSSVTGASGDGGGGGGGGDGGGSGDGDVVKARDKEPTPLSPTPSDHASDKVEADEKVGGDTAVISSPIRLTPDRERRRGRPSRHKETKRGGGGNTRKLPVKERLYISKTDIAAREAPLPPSPREEPSVDGKPRQAAKGTERVISYRKEHKLSSRLANRLGPAPRDKKNTGVGPRGRDRKTSKRDAIAIAEQFRRQKRKAELMHREQEVIKGKRMAKYLNDHHSKPPRSAHRLSGGKEEDLDKRISKIRNNNRRRLEREEEIRKDRQLYG